MGVFALAIVAALAVMGLAALSVFLERLWTFRRARRRSREFAILAGRHLEAGDQEQLERDALARKGDVLAQLIGSGIQTYRRAVAAPPPGKIGAVELARRELGRKSDEVAAQIRRGLGVLASVGSIAPFVGLLGTVVGIIEAFEGIGAAGSAGIGAVSAGIAEALVVTALGLTIAIPAVLMFNYLTARADALLMALDAAKGQLADHLEAHHVDAGGRSARLGGRTMEAVDAA
jgi:biopolymer transport protein ExbB